MAHPGIGVKVASHAAKVSNGKSAPAAKPDDDVDRITSARGTSPALIEKKIADTARRVEDRALILANQFMGLVLKACDDFRTYSKGKIKALDGEVTAGDLMQGLTSAAFGLVGGALLGKVTNQVGKAVASKISDLLKDKVSKATNSKSKDLADLSAAIDNLVKSVGDKALLMNLVTTEIGKRCDAIIASSSAGRALTPEQEDFLGPFYDAGTEVDAALEGFGIPSAASAQKIYLKVYTGLVQNFEKQIYMTKYTMQDKAIQTQSQLEREADAMGWNAADAEHKKREEELKGSE